MSELVKALPRTANQLTIRGVASLGFAGFRPGQLITDQISLLTRLKTLDNFLYSQFEHLTGVQIDNIAEPLHGDWIHTPIIPFDRDAAELVKMHLPWMNARGLLKFSS